jgi:hypothetical protein
MEVELVNGVLGRLAQGGVASRWRGRAARATKEQQQGWPRRSCTNSWIEEKQRMAEAEQQRSQPRPKGSKAARGHAISPSSMCTKSLNVFSATPLRARACQTDFPRARDSTESQISAPPGSPPSASMHASAPRSTLRCPWPLHSCLHP